MDPALLRIKFAPLIRKVHTELDSKCYIEITPKLTAFKNLDKICCWKIDDTLTEYTVPMTYKILIKKQRPNKRDQPKKVYHSCVDLLSCNSGADLGSGDVTRILSDIRPFRLPPPEADDHEMTNEITTKWQATATPHQNIIEQNADNVQTENVPKQKESLVRERALSKKCRGINLIEKSSQTVQKVITRENSTITEGIFKFDKAIEPMQVYKEDDDITLGQNESTNSLQVRLDDFSNKISKYRIQFEPTYSDFAHIFCRSVSVGKMMPEEENDYQTTKSKIALSSENPIILHAIETKLHKTVGDEICESINNASLKKIYFRNKGDQTTPTAKTCGNNTSNFDYYNIHFDLGTSLFDSKYYTGNYYHYVPTLENNKLCIASSDMPSNVILKERKAYMKQQIKSRNTIEAENVQRIVLQNSFRDNDNIQKPKKIRLSPETRVKSILESITNELNPLNSKLNEIKSKCLMLGLGLFCGEFIPNHNAIVCQSITNFSSDAYERTPKEKKSNRVVYTYLFKG